MHSLSYYSLPKTNHDKELNRCSIESYEYPLTVNCAGNFKAAFPLTTDNQSGRKDFYLLYLLSGELDVLIGEETVRASAGSLIIFPPNKRYKYSYSSAEELDYLWVHFTGSYAERLLSECGLSPLPYFSPALNSRRIPEKFKKIFEIFETGGSLQRHELAVTLEQIILSAASKEKGGKKRSLDRSIRYIHLNYNQKISIPELAAMENLSNSRYIALFTDQMGASPTSYIIKLRINSACDLLLTTDLSVKQIGTLVGYDDPHFFSKLFKKHVGLSPKAYKAQK